MNDLTRFSSGNEVMLRTCLTVRGLVGTAAHKSKTLKPDTLHIKVASTEFRIFETKI